MCWRLFIEEYAANLQYIKGVHNVVADALSRLPFTEDGTVEEALVTIETMGDRFRYDIEEQNFDTHPLSFSMLDKAQILDKTLMKALNLDKSLYHLHSFHGEGKTKDLISYKEKNVVPKKLQRHIVDWYHTVLCHPGITIRTEGTIGQHLWWPKMRQHITEYVQSCPICQKSKRKIKKYGLLPPNGAESEPWDRMCIDLIGPYTINKKKKKNLICKCVTMIDPATGWFEIHQYDDKRSITVANISEQEWFSRYPWPTQITYDRGSEFIGADF
jgi:hypothetical protein